LEIYVEAKIAKDKTTQEEAFEKNAEIHLRHDK
jgi:hypothetical protein